MIELINDPETKEVQHLSGVLTYEHASNVAATSDCYALIDVYGRVLACTGLYGNEAWTIFRSNLGYYLLPVFREIRRLLHAHPFPRIVSFISPTFTKGASWMKILGFKLEGSVMHLGSMHDLYSLAKEVV